MLISDIAAAQCGLVDVADIKQMAGVCSHEPDLADDIRSITLLDIDVVTIGIGRAELIIYRKQVDNPSARNRIRQGGEDLLARRPDRHLWHSRWPRG